MLTPGSQSSSFILSSDIINGISTPIWVKHKHSGFKVSYFPHPNDLSLLNTTASHSHGCSPDLVITRNCTTSKSLNSNITSSDYNQSFLAHLVIASFFMTLLPCADQYIGPVFLIFIDSPSFPFSHVIIGASLSLTFSNQSNIKSCQLYLQIMFIYFLCTIVFPGSGSQYRLNSISQMSEALKINVGGFHICLGCRSKRESHFHIDNGKKMDLKNHNVYPSQQRAKVISKQNKLNPKDGQTSTKRNKTHVLFHLRQNTGERNGCHISK